MRKVTAVIVSSLILTLFANIAFAKDATSSPTRRNKEFVAQRQENIKEKMASREAALKSKLALFKDQRKANLTSRVNDTLAMINQQRTSQMLKYLDNMSRILSKLETRVNSGSSDIKDVTAAKAAIADSKAKIASAAAAVKVQQAKDYTIQVSSETTVKADAKLQRDKLQSALLTLRKLLIDAKQSVANAIRVAHGEQPEKEGSESAK